MDHAPALSRTPAILGTNNNTRAIATAVSFAMLRVEINASPLAGAAPRGRQAATQQHAKSSVQDLRSTSGARVNPISDHCCSDPSLRSKASLGLRSRRAERGQSSVEATLLLCRHAAGILRSGAHRRPRAGRLRSDVMMSPVPCDRLPQWLADEVPIICADRWMSHFGCGRQTVRPFGMS